MTTLNAQIETFFKLLFGQKPKGRLCIALLGQDLKMTQSWFNYPADIQSIADTAIRYGATHNVYFCPHLFSDDQRKKEYVLFTPNVWADLDFCSPDKLMVEPTVLVESSPGRFQAYWVLDNPETLPEEAEALARRIAYHHANDGCDRSGWDLTQLLRVPTTTNFKYMDSMNVPVVKVVKANKNYYRESDFSAYPTLNDYTYTDVPLPAELLDQSALDIISKHETTLNPIIYKLFNDPQPDPTGWSEDLFRLEMSLFESGFSKEQVFIVANEAKCNKYARAGRPPLHLWKDVCKAEARFEASKQILVKKPEVATRLLTSDERSHVNSLEFTFVERYIDWASGLGDAAKQYHQAGAFIILSSILSGTVTLPTSYDVLIPNLWFMVLGDTTLTRKTTSMNIAMSIVEAVDPSLVMATDGSVEGIFTNLAVRPGKPSIFLRDEFSGLIASMIKKDYMADLPEMLTKMYDGKMQRRLLRKEVIEVSDPRLLIYAGGIKSKVTSLLQTEHVSSGFIPRFIFITAESDITKLRPLGPPTVEEINSRRDIINEVKSLHAFYAAKRSIKIENVDQELNVEKKFEAKLTDEAWKRYNILESTLIEMGMESNTPELMTPVGDRLSKSILKAAVLIGASRQRNAGTDVVINVEDMLRAIRYGEMWFSYVTEIIEGINSTPFEKLVGSVVKFIRMKPEGVSRSMLMRTYKLSAREATSLFVTMEERGLIKTQRTSNQILYFAEDRF